MKKILFALLLVLNFNSCESEKAENERILIIVSNTEDMGDQEKEAKNG